MAQVYTCFFSSQNKMKNNRWHKEKKKYHGNLYQSTPISNKDGRPSTVDLEGGSEVVGVLHQETMLHQGTLQCLLDAVADPGFPEGGGRRLRFEKFVCQNERIWTRRGGRAPAAPPLDPPLGWSHQSSFSFLPDDALSNSHPFNYRLLFDVFCYW